MRLRSRRPTPRVLPPDGARFAASNRLYGGSITQFSRTFQKFDWQCDFVDADDPAAVEAALDAGAKALFVESLANPGGVVSDLETLTRLTKAAGAGPEVVGLSIGLETVDDLIRDLDRGLAAA